MSDWLPSTSIATRNPIEHGLTGRVCCLALGLFVLAAAAVVHGQYPATLIYQARGDRSEGLVAEPKSADAVILVSALADVKPHETYDQWPKALRLRFYLPKDQRNAHVAVRQIPSPRGYYTLDNVETPKPWVAASVNEFQWPADVIARVYDFQIPANRRTTVTKDDWMTDLGVVVTLGDDKRAPFSQNVAVAPAALFSSSQPLEVVAYQFTFRANAPADVTDSIVSSSNSRVFSDAPRTAIANSPFTVRWPVGCQPEGWYQLVMDASFKSAPTRPSQQWVVRFYHKPSLK